VELAQRPDLTLAELVQDLIQVDAASTTELNLPADLPYEKWEALGRLFAALRNSLKWWAGDWLIFGEATYGEQAAQALDLLGVDRAVQDGWRYVCMYVPRSRRRKALSFSHHREVAPLKPRQQSRLLAKAEKEGLTAKDLRTIKREIEAAGEEMAAEQPQWTKDDVIEDLRGAAKLVSKQAQPNGDGSYLVPAEPIARLRSALPRADGGDLMDDGPDYMMNDVQWEATIRGLYLTGVLVRRGYTDEAPLLQALEAAVIALAIGRDVEPSAVCKWALELVPTGADWQEQLHTLLAEADGRIEELMEKVREGQVPPEPPLPE
jgi:hypothetical protein